MSYLQPPTSGPENILEAELIVISLFTVKESRNTHLICKHRVQHRTVVQVETDLAQQFAGGLPSVLFDAVEEEVVSLVDLKVVHLLLDVLDPLHHLLDPVLGAAAGAAGALDLARYLIYTPRHLTETAAMTR